MTNPLISVIIPVYNVQQFLSECLDSVLKQTYNNIEVIAINDGSTDHSLDILKEYALNYINLTVISQENCGVSVARNKGIDVSNGKYIYFLDSDDYILPETFENLIGLMEKQNLDLIRFAAEPFVDGIDIKINEKQYDFLKYFEKGKLYEKEEFLNINLKAFGTTVYSYIMRRDLIINNNIRFKSGIIHEDELFTLELFLNTNLAMYDTKYYYRRRYRENSIMTSQSSEMIKKSFDSYFILIKEMNKLLERYTSLLEVKLIKSRIRPTYIALIHKNIDEKYKRNELSKIEGISISRGEQFYYTLKYKAKKYLKYLKRCVLQ